MKPRRYKELILQFRSRKRGEWTEDETSSLSDMPHARQQIAIEREDSPEHSWRIIERTIVERVVR